VELLAYEIDQYNLPQWFNYIPSIIILVIVMLSIIGDEEEEKDSRKEAKDSPPSK